VLKPGLLVLYNGTPHRVEHVNTCRAYIVPLRKYKRSRVNRTLPKGVSIGADAILPILSEADAETALTAGPPSDTHPDSPARLVLPGWVAKDAPTYRAGSLNERVLTYILLHPRQRTPQIVAALKHDERRNILACLRRLYTSGVIAKE